MKIKITYEQEDRQMRRKSVSIFDALTYDQRERILDLMRQLVNRRKETA